MFSPRHTAGDKKIDPWPVALDFSADFGRRRYPRLACTSSLPGAQVGQSITPSKPSGHLDLDVHELIKLGKLEELVTSFVFTRIRSMMSLSPSRGGS